MTRNVLTVARREFRSFFDQPTAYILVVVFLAVNFFFYFRTVFISAEATLRPMFDLLPWLLLFFVPAVCMRTLAEERAQGTLELILAQPLRGIDLLIGKFLGIMGFMAVALLGTAGAFIALRMGSEPFAGVAVAQYVGALLLTSGLVAVGLWASSLTRNQITAFIVAVTVTFALMAITMDIVLLGLPGALANAATRLGLLTHFENIARGVIDLRDVVYYVSVTAAFLALAYLGVERERLNRRGSRYRDLWLGTLGILAISVVVNLLGQNIRGRVDLTPGGAYTLSGPTRSLLRELDDLVTVRLFASRELPPQAAIVRRDMEDLLADYASVAGDRMQYTRYAPQGDNDDRKEADRFNIPAIQFNVLGQEELQVRQGYLGIALQYADRVETIPWVQQTADLEYRLTSLIRGMTETTRPHIGFLAGHGEPETTDQYGILAERLGRNYDVETVRLDPEAPEVADIDVLVVAGPLQPLSEAEGEAVGRFLASGRDALFAYASMGIDEARVFSAPQPHPALDSLLQLYGVAMPAALALDLRSSGNVTQSTGGGLSFVIPYPLWPIVRPASPSVIVEQLSGVLLPWVSPLDLSAADPERVTPLLATTEAGGLLPGQAPVSPQFDWKRAASDLGPRPVAAALRPAEGSGMGRLIVVGNAVFGTNRFIQAQPENLLFLENAIDWLAQEESLISIRAKSRRPPALQYASESARNAAKYANLVGLPLLFVLFGIMRLLARRRLQATPYTRPGDLETT